MGQQHHVPRHRLRVRRAADRAALPGEGSSSRCRRSRSGTSRSSRSLLRRPHPARRPRPRQLDIADVAGRRVVETALRTGHRPGGERRRRAGGDEPVRRATRAGCRTCRRRWRPVATSTVDRISWSIPTRRSRRTGRRASTGSCARRSTWARGRWRPAAATRRSPPPGSAPRPGSPALSTPAPAGRSSRLPSSERAAGPGAGRGRPGRPVDELDTDWLLLDCELLPWSAKAEELLRDQYAAVGAAARAALPAALAALDAAAGARAAGGRAARPDRGPRGERRRRSPAAYRRYCWPIDGLRRGDASRRSRCWPPRAGRTHDRRARLASRRGRPAGARRTRIFFTPTRRRVVDLDRRRSRWRTRRPPGGSADRRRRRGHGGQADGDLPRGRRRSACSRASRCRGREYLRIIYGPDYTEPANLTGCGSANLGHKRVAGPAGVRPRPGGAGPVAAGEPLWRVHEPVFAVLALRVGAGRSPPVGGSPSRVTQAQKGASALCWLWWGSLPRASSAPTPMWMVCLSPWIVTNSGRHRISYSSGKRRPAPPATWQAGTVSLATGPALGPSRRRRRTSAALDGQGYTSPVPNASPHW